MKLNEEQEARVQQLAHEGRITPDLIVADARNKDSPLHSLFEWDQEKGHKHYLLMQAREVIRSVRVERTILERTVQVVRYMKDPEVPANKQGYIDVEQLLTDDDNARKALDIEFQRAAAALKRARDIAAVLGFGADVDQLIENIAAAKSRIEVRATSMTTVQ